MGIGMVGSATYVAAIPTAQIGIPRSDYKTPSPTTGIYGSCAAAADAVGIDNTSSSSRESDSDKDLGGGPISNPTNARKRKRGASGGAGVGGSTSHCRMMYFLEGLMKQGLMQQVVEKQEAMQQRFLETIEGLMKQFVEKQEAMQQRVLETIEKSEQERMVREEAWRRQEMARIIREQEMMALDREITASRHATIIAFLQKIIGQSVPLPYPITIDREATPALDKAQPLQPQSIPPPAALDPPPSPQRKQHQHHQIIQHQPQQQKPPQSSDVIITHHHQPYPTDHVTIAAPEQQHLPAQQMGSGKFDPASSRWQETEVLEFIKLKSGLDSRYREAGLKGWELWGEISAEMGRMGYSRSAKRCKEKWNNINTSFKRFKEGKIKLPLPYFHQLDALHRKKVLGGSNQTNQEPPIDHNQSSYTSSSPVDPNQTPTTLEEIMAPPPSPPQFITNESVDTNIKSNGRDISNIGSAASVAREPEDFVKELMEQRQSNHHQQPQPMTMGTEPFTMGYYSKMMGEDNYNIEDDAEMDDLDDDEDTTKEIEDEDRNTCKMNYNIESHNRLNTGFYDGTANAAASRITLGLWILATRYSFRSLLTPFDVLPLGFIVFKMR